MTPSAPRDATAHRFVVAASMALTGAGVLALLLPLVTGRAMLVRDLLFWVIPSRGLVRDAWAHGTPTAWNAFEGLGFATAADPLFMPFYPPNVLTLWLPLHWGTSLLFGLHIALGTLGAYGLARRFDASAPSAAVGALAWCLAGLTGSMIPTGTLLLPSAWIPALACAAVDLGTAARRGASTLSAALALGLGGAMMLLTGEVFVTLMAALPVLGCLYAATRDASAPDARARPLVGALASGLGLAALLALCLSAPSWWPALQLLGATPRSLPLSPAELDVWSMHPLSLADLVSPNAAVRTPDRGLVRLVDGSVLFVTVYLGATTLALCLLAPTRRGRPIVHIVWAVALVGVLLALGRHLPVLSLVRTVVRPFTRMRSPVKFLLLVHPMLALAAALGAERVLQGASPWRRVAGVVVPLALLAALAFGGLLPLAPLRAHILGGAMLGALVRVGMLAVALGAVRRWGPRAALVLPLAVALDLGPPANGIHLWHDPAPFARRPPLADALHSLGDATRRGAAPPRLWRSPRVTTDTSPDARTAPFLPMHTTLRPKLNVPWGVAVVNGYDAAISTEVNTLSESGRVAALRLLSVDAALLSSPTPPPATRPIPSPVGGAALYALTRPLPRAFVAHAARADVPARPLPLDDESLLTGAVVTLPPADLAALPARDAQPPSACTITAWAPGDVTLRCDATAPGLAVLVEQSSPGWSVTVDGRPAQMLTVNRTMLGAAVTAGTHTVQWRFRTPGMGLGYGLAALGAALALGLWLRTRHDAR
jgi:hypothetical protein